MVFEKVFKLNKQDYLFKNINFRDRTKVMNLFQDCEDFFVLTEGKVPEDCKEFFFDVPPNKRIENKHLFGVFNKEALIGVVDIVEDFPEKEEWIIGLMLLHPDTRGTGLGKMVHNILVDIARNSNAKKLRVGVVEQNINGLIFWRKVGYEKIKTTEPLKFGSKTSKVIVMNYYLS